MADLFSCGVIFYLILTGNIPFNGSSYKKIVMRNMSGLVNFDLTRYGISVSKETMNLLKALLEKNPEKRIRPIQALEHEAFHRILSKSPLV